VFVCVCVCVCVCVFVCVRESGSKESRSDTTYDELEDKQARKLSDKHRERLNKRMVKLSERQQLLVLLCLGRYVADVR
jgi:hypothetical protein